MLASTHKIIAKTSACNILLQVSFTQSTGVKSATLGKNGTEHLMRLDRDKCKFPIVLSFNFMVCTQNYSYYLIPFHHAIQLCMRSRGCGGGIQPTFDPPFCSVLLKLALNFAYQISLNRYAHQSQTPRRATETTPLTTARASQRRFSISMCSSSVMRSLFTLMIYYQN